MKRLIIVYNPRSARFLEVQKKVIEKSRSLKGWMVLKFEVKRGDAKEDAKDLEKILKKGDLVISAGGDGTATMVMNAIVNSEKLATMGVVGLGNFNDFAISTGELKFLDIVKRFEQGKYEEFYPLEVKVNGEHFWYAGMYFTIGLMAESTRVLEKPRNKKKIAKAKNRMEFAANRLFRWYLVNKWRKDFLPEDMTINEKGLKKNTTDYVAMNGESLAGVLEAEGWTRGPEEFWSGTMRNRSFFRMFGKFVAAMEGELPGKATQEDKLKFKKPVELYLHVEGEAWKLEKIKEIAVKKNGESLRIIRKA